MFLSLEQDDFNSAVERMKKNRILFEPSHPLEQAANHGVDWAALTIHSSSFAWKVPITALIYLGMGQSESEFV